MNKNDGLTIPGNGEGYSPRKENTNTFLLGVIAWCHHFGK